MTPSASVPAPHAAPQPAACTAPVPAARGQGPDGIRGALQPAAALRAVALLALALPGMLPFAFSRSAAGQAVPPDEDWRQLVTEHFVVTYPAPLEDLARQAGSRAERAWTLLADRFVETPNTPVQVLLTDHADIANGFASPAPYNRITIFARPPTDGGSISYYDDWLEMVVTHELVHTFHLDMTGLPGSVIRAMFGRTPMAWPVFPSAATPTWFVEGLAVYFESALTGAGRAKGTWQEMVLRTAALAGDLGTSTQVSGETPRWPGGHRPYVYGARYMEHVAEVHGERALSRFARSVADQWVPYRLNAAARDALGSDVKSSWEAWSEGLTRSYRVMADELGRSVPVTTGATVEGAGRLAGQAVVSRDGLRLAFLRSDGVDAAQIRVSDPAGANGRSLTRVNGVGGSLSWAPDGGLFFTQLDFTDRYRLTGDLYRTGPGGSVERVTRGERISFADVSPDGRRAVAVQEGGGTNALVIVDLSSGRVAPLLPKAPGRHWAFPRWSPDGTRIAVVRWEAPAMMDIVVLDQDGVVVAELTRDRAVDTTPFWTPDGSAIVWSSDRTGIPNLFAATLAGDQVGEVRQVTNMLGGASHPSVDPSGRWTYFSSYHADGWHVERIPHRPGDWFPPQPTSPRFEQAPAEPSGADAAAASPAPAAPAPPSAQAATLRPYRAFETLRPYHWRPLFTAAERGSDPTDALHTVIKPFVGVAIGGSDLVGRHAYSLAARATTDAGRFSGRLAYSYRGWGNPVLGMSLSQSHDASSRTLDVRFPDGSLRPYFLLERERAATVSTSFLRQRYRTLASFSLNAGLVREDRTIQGLDGESGPRLARPRADFTQLGATVSASNTQRRALSISREDGVRGFVSARTLTHRNVPADSGGVIGLDRSYRQVTAEVSAFKSWVGSALPTTCSRCASPAAPPSGPGPTSSTSTWAAPRARPSPPPGWGSSAVRRACCRSADTAPTTARGGSRGPPAPSTASPLPFWTWGCPSSPCTSIACTARCSLTPETRGAPNSASRGSRIRARTP